MREAQAEVEVLVRWSRSRGLMRDPMSCGGWRFRGLASFAVAPSWFPWAFYQVRQSPWSRWMQAPMLRKACVEY